jgi:hypothetical protein
MRGLPLFNPKPSLAAAGPMSSRDATGSSSDDSRIASGRSKAPRLSGKARYEGGSEMHRMKRVAAALFGLAVLLGGGLPALAAPSVETAMVIESKHLRYAVGSDASNLSFIDRATGVDYRASGAAACARVRKTGREYPARAASWNAGRLTLDFGDAGVTAVLKVNAAKQAITIEVVSVEGDGIEWLLFADIPLSLKGELEEPFAACALALNLKTRVPDLPRRSSRLRAFCYPRTGLAGAAVALVAAPPAQLRAALQDVVRAAPELPKSPIGGLWALDSPDNRGSYLFNFGDLSEETVDDWIRLAKTLGSTQIDFHGGRSFRFGDCEPNPKTYPRGIASLKAVIDRLHAAGIKAGLHTYAMFIDKRCPWVTPVPHPDLGKDATFTLATELSADATTVPVVESTEKMSATTGFFVRNSVTLQIDDELITYTGVSKEAPFQFIGCKRGAFGTRVSAHAKGAKVHHLRECFGLFVPDGDSPLFEEVAARTAQTYNDAGFDMIYLDALDGGDTVAGREWAWHYEAKFTWEIWKRLKRPAIMEMSTFHHHLWYVRSRGGAWDHPTRSHKKFIDIHVAANEAYQRMFLPGHLGWWAFKTWSGASGDPTYPDDIEYLCAKALGHDTGFSIMGVDPTSIRKAGVLPRLSAIVRRYEALRHAGYFNEAVKEKLRVPGDEYRLVQAPDGEWCFVPAQYERHKVQGLDGWSNVWKVSNRFAEQPLKLRIQGLLSAGPYDAPGNPTLASFGAPDEFERPRTQNGITLMLQPSRAHVKAGGISGCLTASSALPTATRTWGCATRTFGPPLDLSAHQGLGVWVHGDGKGEVLNLQLTSPLHLSHAIADHYIDVNFTGWRYFELIEPEGARHADYAWPYGGIYSIYRESVRPSSIETLSLYVNNVPANGSVTTYLSPVRAVPVVKAKLRNPAVSVNGKTLTFPVEIESGQALEYLSPTECRLYAPSGELIREVTPVGEAPILKAGENEVRFMCEPTEGVNPRAYVWTITEGELLRGANPPEKVAWRYLNREEEAPVTLRASGAAPPAWEVISRAHPGPAHLETEVTVDALAPPESLYRAEDALSLESFETLDAFAETPDNRYLQYVVSGSLKGVSAPPGVTHQLELSKDVVKEGKHSARYMALSPMQGGWSARGRRFAKPIDLSRCTDIGFLIHGDGAGEVFYVQLRDTSGAHFDMKTVIDFTGWKCVQFPLAGAGLDLSKIEYLILYYNNLPAGKRVTCYIDDIRGLRDPSGLRRPWLSVGGKRVLFPVTLSPGERLEAAGRTCRVYAADGSLREEVKLKGALPRLKPGPNRIAFDADAGKAHAYQVRVRLTKLYP